MSERGILFSAPMVRAILAGTKAQTRRACNPQPEKRHPFLAFKKQRGPDFWLWPNAREEIAAECLYGQPGDRLWVRETFLDLGACYLYRADANAEQERALVAPNQSWCSSIFMPRRASRITLEITAVRVERLQDISEADAKAEGVERWAVSTELQPASGWWRDYSLTPAEELAGQPPLLSARDSYRTLWEQINGPGSWAANPWVWVLDFKRVA